MGHARQSYRRWQSRSFHRYRLCMHCMPLTSVQICLLVWTALQKRSFWMQATSACACERIWSTYGYIHNKSRNRLTAGRAEKLVFTFSNLRFLKRLLRIGFEEECWSWEEPEEEQEQENEQEGQPEEAAEGQGDA